MHVNIQPGKQENFQSTDNLKRAKCNLRRAEPKDVCTYI